MPGLRAGLVGYEAPPHLGLIDDDENPREAAVIKPSEAELAQHHVAPGRPAAVPLGVAYQGPWRPLADGMARHVREQARALSLYLPVNLSDAGTPHLFEHELEEEVLRAVGCLQRVHCERQVCAVRHIVFNSPETLLSIVSPGGARLSGQVAEQAVWRATVVYTSWERDRVGEQLVRELSRLGGVWVPCRANREAFVSSGLPPSLVHVVPYPFDGSENLAAQIGAPRGQEEVPSGRRFYAIGKWEPRKAQDRLIGAFLLAFTPKQKVSLTIKTFGWGKWKNYPSMQESGARWASDPAVLANGWTRELMARRVRVIDERLSDVELADLHRQNNIYVSASHGEAWDIPAFEARLAGNSLVHVGYGGSEDYCSADEPNQWRVPYRMAEVHPDYGWESGALWAEYELADLVAALRQARPPERRYQPLHLGQRYSRAVVGALMRDLLCDMVSEQDAALAMALREVGSYA